MIESLMQTWEDPHARHAALVHIPIVLGGLAIIPVCWLAVTGFRRWTPRIVAILFLLGASVGAGLAAGPGEEARDRLPRDGAALTEVEEAAVKLHSDLGEGGWAWPLIAAVLVGFTAAPWKSLRVGAGVISCVAALAVAGWVAYAGHTGGKLVYVHGLGVPARSTDAPAGGSPGGGSAEAGGGSGTSGTSNASGGSGEHEADEHAEGDAE